MYAVTINKETGIVMKKHTNSYHFAPIIVMSYTMVRMYIFIHLLYKVNLLPVLPHPHTITLFSITATIVSPGVDR